MNDNGTYRWVRDNAPQPKQPVNWKKIKTVVLVAVLALVLLIGSSSCFYTVDDKQQAVVTTFGKVTDITDAGLHFKVPFGIQQVQTVDVKIQDSEPPTREVVEAFKAVETAKQQAETVVNDAKAYQNAQLPDAQAQADKLVQNAQFLKQKRINEATQQVAMFTAMYAEYAQDPDITRSRMYYEAISEILPGVRLYINTGDGSSVDMLLPLESLTGGGN